MVLEQIGHDDDQVSDQLCYLTRTKDGKTLKSSSVYIHDEHGKVAAILGINYDISMMQMFENTRMSSIPLTHRPAKNPSASR